MTIKAGVAAVNISPTKPMFLFGYPHVPRTSSGIHDPLYASAMSIAAGSGAIMFIAVDVLMLTHDIVHLCRKAIAKSTGIPTGNILISTTHTHSGPVTVDLLAFRDDSVLPCVDPEYIKIVSEGIITAAITAYRKAVPAVAAVTTAKAVDVGGNRHTLEGISDPQVGILYLKRKDNLTPLAINLTYSMHPTVLHEDSTLVSSDFPYFVRKYLSEQLKDITVLYHTGPSGNQSPRYYVKEQTFTEADRIGTKLGVTVLKALQSLRKSDFSDDFCVSASQAFVELPGREFPTAAQSQTMLKEAVEKYERLKKEGASHGPVRTAECTIFGAEERVTLSKAQEKGEIELLRKKYTPVEIQVLRVANNFWVGLPGEIFVEYGLEIKKQSPKRTFVISLANGELQGYIVTPDADGYEASLSLFAPQAGNILVETSINLINQLEKEN